jgi:hypothetical protein
MRFYKVVLTASIFLCGSAFGLDLKGVELGKFAPAEQLHSELGMKCFRAKCGQGHTVIAGAQCTTAVAFNDEKMVDEIVAVFSFSDFEAVKEALINKYGKPTEHFTAQGTTGNGIHLTRVTGIWRDDAGNEMMLQNYSDALHGRLVLRTKARIELDRQRASEI